MLSEARGKGELAVQLFIKGSNLRLTFLQIPGESTEDLTPPQNDIGNEKAPTTIVAAISSTIRRYPMNVELRPPEGGLTGPFIIKTSQILTISKQRLERRFGSLSNNRMNEVDRAIKLSLSLS